MTDTPTTRCSSCGSGFACDPAGACWCKAPPYLPMPAVGATCLCPACLEKARAAARARAAP